MPDDKHPEGGVAAPQLTVILPVHNEENHLEEILRRLLASPCPIEREIIAVDDGSTDRSLELLEKARSDHGIKLIRRPASGGKGTAVIDGIAAASGDYIMVHDADLEYEPNDIHRLLAPLLDDRADVVYGSRFRREHEQVHRTLHFLGNRLLTSLSNLLSGIYLSDMETCYKLFRADLLRSMRLRSRQFGIEVELTAYCAKVQARIFELPISYYPRTRLAGKKIGWRDGVAALWHLVRFNLLISPDRAFRDLPERYRP